MMQLKKKLMITLGIISVVIISSLTSMQQAPQPQAYKNLKVLPKKLTHDQLGKVMDEWSHALGVRCGFCHTRGADGRNDFASDAKPEKLMARKMYAMTAKINKKYFEGKKDSLGMVMESGIACITCHHGAAHPDGMQKEGVAEKK